MLTSSSHRRPPSKPRPLSRILDQLASNLGIEKKLLETQAMLLWDEVAGTSLSRVSSPMSVRRGKLFVAVKTASWRNQLTFMKGKILHQINQQVGRNVLKDIVFLSDGGRSSLRSSSPENRGPGRYER